jgi:sphinganine-1-phosphate aldolase
MYKERKFIHYQYYVTADWTGGIAVMPTLAGSRSGGIVAATWAALVQFGVDGYVEATRQLVSTLQDIAKG